MSLVLTCDIANLTIDQGIPSCSDWQVYEYTDTSNLVQIMDEQLGFDLETFGQLSGFFLVCFITALAAGKVARTLGRV